MIFKQYFCWYMQVLGIDMRTILMYAYTTTLCVSGCGFTLQQFFCNIINPLFVSFNLATDEQFQKNYWGEPEQAPN